MTDVTFAEYLDILRPHIPIGLISVGSFEAIHQIARYIPGALAFSTFGFECRLGVPEATTDFLFSLTSDNSGPDILAGYLSADDFAPELFHETLWSRVREFGKRWADPSSFFQKTLDDVWIEFDVHKHPDRLPLPNLFFGSFYHLGPAELERWGVPDVLSLLESVHVCVRGKSPAPSVVRTLQSCIENLPRLKSLFQVGMMLARPDKEGLRICMFMPSRESLIQYLADVGWQGCVKKLEPMLKRIFSLFDSISIHLDVSDDVSPKIGMECKFLHRREPDREPRWYEFLDFLEKRGLCIPEKKEALLAYPGHARTDLETCPFPLQRLGRRLEMAYASFFVRNIYHVKLVYNESSEWEAKGYLGVNHIWKNYGGELLRGRGKWGLIRP